MILNDYKNLVSHTGFIHTDILKTIEERQRRKDNLYLGLVLGTNYGKVVKITTHTADGIIDFEGVILALTIDYVIMKDGLKIPVIAVEAMRIY